MADSFLNTSTQRYALVTGANGGIGFEICKQLASRGIMVVLTDKDEQKCIEAQERLKEFGFSDRFVFHQLDVVDSNSITSIYDFIKSKFGRLDILVNNAGVSGIARVEGDPLIVEELILASLSDEPQGDGAKANGSVIQTYEGAQECLQTNYYGANRTTEALIPLLKLSDSPRIVNISSSLGLLKVFSSEWVKRVLSDPENLTEEKIDEVVKNFLKSFKEGSLEGDGWPTQLSSYKVSKAALSAYTRLMARKYPSFRINCVCPGFVRTNITCNQGFLSADEAAEAPVKLALVPHGGPSGLFFRRFKVSPF
ncbi:(+)-neomenthol dehydrogenase [Striga hermonthica]|uniref:(+)-neomenthol dehydrogenase n=1 Tax=Striga hermonthica TaxID=68872 RepID=A0A9N7NTJ4_STRHE|nr:(+)-neomenthol dehydrogenase [Striga hermonthica]